MQLQTEQDEEPEINLTSLIDVVFLLLIFFMVSATFERQALLRVVLPEASTARQEAVADRIDLVVTETGEYFLGESMLADTRKPTLELALRQAFDEAPDAALVIRADANARHQLVVRALDAAAAQGISRLSIATVEEDGSEP
ncbi:biopolymer transporter ExbD [Wenzhouxiangella sp. XN79A]|uniref:ExbD/TolR family protein n=1 Tax=Wenzhouxiangella sp. XN79A TaxID=2724193 RepID=UPI00144AE5F1|nr:biopolymer transporter ExbD [Wenzhouxiangella sp. XN79A]NKI35483.1 biopolymer transporter ExbD [Wenzhouxiangella sp. XN79A]